MFQFGPFVVDEPARALRLKKRDVALQPRVFDLLVYLIRNRERVVGKEELLDTLWPGVTVTDNSLQRAISHLRASLREGGMEDAVKNFPRSGYRFCAEATEIAGTPNHAASPAEACEAWSHQNWAEAAAHYEQADKHTALDGQDLDRWALSLQCLGRKS